MVCDDRICNIGVEHIVGCYTSASRKQVIPIVERTERLLWHPARYEGFESSDNVIYVGAAPNHTVVPLVRDMLEHLSSDVFCIGSNYVWTWETNRVIRELVTSAGGRVLAERLLELGERAVDTSSRKSPKKPPMVFNTLVGRSSYVFIRAFHPATEPAGIDIPVLSCSLCEPELAIAVRPRPAASRPPPISRPSPAREPRIRRALEGSLRRRQPPFVDGQSTYVAFICCARHAPRRYLDIDEVRRAAADHRYDSPQGPVWIDGSNNHCFLTPRLAVSNARGQFDIFWEADAPVKPDPYLTQLDVAVSPSRETTTGETSPNAPHLRVVK